jgi:hypothetical protein
MYVSEPSITGGQISEVFLEISGVVPDMDSSSFFFFFLADEKSISATGAGGIYNKILKDIKNSNSK